MLQGCLLFGVYLDLGPCEGVASKKPSVKLQVTDTAVATAMVVATVSVAEAAVVVGKGGASLGSAAPQLLCLGGCIRQPAACARHALGLAC